MDCKHCLVLLSYIHVVLHILERMLVSDLVHVTEMVMNANGRKEMALNNANEETKK